MDRIKIALPLENSPDKKKAGSHGLIKEPIMVGSSSHGVLLTHCTTPCITNESC